MRILFLFIFGIALAAPAFVHAASWPASSGTLISSALSSTTPPSGNVFEPSDVTFAGDELLLVSDEGDVATMNVDGGNLAEWLTWAHNDLEGATIVGDTLYLLNERERDVYAYDVTTHELLRTYDLSSWISGWDNEGPEGLVYHNGQWLVGHSYTEEIYAFDLSGDEPSFLGSWNSGLHVRAMHSGEDGKLYVMSGGRIVVFSDDGTSVEYTLPGTAVGPEGLALSMDCAAGMATAFIAYDSGSVYRYENFSVTCPVTPEPEPDPEPVPVDADGDGVIVDDDCNDADASVSVVQTYYRDADGDTLGNVAETTSVCSSTAPDGYVTNASDANDADYDNDGVSTSLDCNDADASLSTTATYYRDADGDTLGDAGVTTDACSSTPPAGYVTNTNDTDDAQAYFSATGTTNGSIVVTYGDGSSKTYQIFAMTTSRTTTVAQYKDSSYLVAISSNWRRIAVVDPYTGSVVASRAMTWRYSVLVNWLVSVIGY